jgi:hypothetical protein
MTKATFSKRTDTTIEGWPTYRGVVKNGSKVVWVCMHKHERRYTNPFTRKLGAAECADAALDAMRRSR